MLLSLTNLPQPGRTSDTPEAEKNKIRRVYTSEQILKLRIFFEGDMHEGIVTFVSTYGLRRRKVAGLRWGNIDMLADTFRICHMAIFVNGRTVYVDNTKNEASNRTLLITLATKKFLLELKAKQEQMKADFGDEYHDTVFVFCWDDGKLLVPEYIPLHFRKMLQQSNLPIIHFHDLRHIVATLLHETGSDL